MAPAHWMLTGTVFDPSRLGAGTYEVSNLQLSGQETIDGGPAVLVEYDLSHRTAAVQDRASVHVRLWSHETEFRPLRRVLARGGDRPWTRTETCSRWEPNVEVDESRFALP